MLGCCCVDAGTGVLDWHEQQGSKGPNIVGCSNSSSDSSSHKPKQHERDQRPCADQSNDQEVNEHRNNRRERKPKMKKYTLAKLMLSVVVFGCSMANAQTNSLAVLSSRAGVMAYALSQVAWVSASASSPSYVDNNGSRPYVHLKYNGTAGDANEIARTLNGEQLYFSVTGTQDAVWLSVVYESADNEVLFSGSKQTKLVGGGFYYYLQDSSVELDVSSRIAVSVPGVIGARFILRDTSGAFQGDVYLDVDPVNGKFYFPTELAGKGQVVLTIADMWGGSYAQAFDLASHGEQIDPSLVIVWPWAYVRNIHSYQDPDSIYETPQSSNGIGISPLVQVKITGHRSDVLVFAKTSEGEVATAVWVLSPGSAEPVRYPVNQATGSTDPIHLVTGLYNVFFEWAGFHEYQPEPYYRYDEKG